MRQIIILPVIASLAACSGGGSSPSFDAQVTQGQELLDEVLAADVTPSATAIPSSGVARYNGYVYGEVTPPEGGGTLVIGTLSVEADFQSRDLSGSAGTFRDSDNGQYGGRLRVDGEIEVRGGIPGMAMDMTGNLTSPDGDDLTVDAELAGAFRGPTGEYAGGVAEGAVTSGDEVRETFDGSFLLER